ncbi:hypothetical protein AS149_37460 [Burkholderia cenocepacia]|nr:hypothetical protein AS149_37460 [Burkholderia cenocepacia]
MLQAQANALDVIHLVQTQLLRLALQIDLPDSACRLVKSDVAESILAKDVHRITDMPEYQVLTERKARESALEAGLYGTLLTWLASRLEFYLAHKLMQAALDSMMKPTDSDI